MTQDDLRPSKTRAQYRQVASKGEKDRQMNATKMNFELVYLNKRHKVRKTERQKRKKRKLQKDRMIERQKVCVLRPDWER